KRALTAVSAVLVLLCGMSRFILGVHYPTDVIAGFAEAVIVILLMRLMERKIPNKWVRYLVIALLALPGWFFCRSNDFYVGFGMLLGMIPADYLEERFVNFRETRKPLRAIVRVVIALGLFVGLNALLKLPFPKEVLEAADLRQYVIRTVRYALIVFLILGVYPLSFRFWDRKESLAEKA
ncbi:MAG: phosphatase PAP2 family protein, partial [Lachnospiraceae bacterium]|nr:phosphatase PAP2 family protein [Lachnospiraceae bacterium]